MRHVPRDGIRRPVDAGVHREPRIRRAAGARLRRRATSSRPASRPAPSTNASGFCARSPIAAKRSTRCAIRSMASGRPSTQSSPTFAMRTSNSGLSSIISSTRAPETALPARIDWSTGLSTQSARSGAFSRSMARIASGSFGTRSPASSHTSADCTARPPPPPTTPTAAADSPAATSPRRKREPHEHVDQLVERIDFHRSRLPQRRAPYLPPACERRRVRCGRARSGARAAALEDHDRLRRGTPAQRFEQPPSVAGAFDVGADNACRGVVGQVVEEIGLGEVERIAVTHDLAEAQAARRAVQHQFDGVVAALRKKRDVARLPRQVRPERHPAGRVVHTHAVRADQPDAGVRGARLHLALERRGLGVAGLAEPPGEQMQRRARPSPGSPR